MLHRSPKIQTIQNSSIYDPINHCYRTPVRIDHVRRARWSALCELNEHIGELITNVTRARFKNHRAILGNVVPTLVGICANLQSKFCGKTTSFGPKLGLLTTGERWPARAHTEDSIPNQRQVVEHANREESNVTSRNLPARDAASRSGHVAGTSLSRHGSLNRATCNNDILRLHQLHQSPDSCQSTIQHPQSCVRCRSSTTTRPGYCRRSPPSRSNSSTRSFRNSARRSQQCDR